MGFYLSGPNSTQGKVKINIECGGAGGMCHLTAEMGVYFADTGTSRKRAALTFRRHGAAQHFCSREKAWEKA